MLSQCIYCSKIVTEENMSYISGLCQNCRTPPASPSEINASNMREKMKRKSIKNKSGTNLEVLRLMKEEEIDCSDIPETDENFWKEAEVFLPGEFMKPQTKLLKTRSVS